MEGCATSVTDSVQLPEQPAAGETLTTPLGGNGWSDPHSRTFCSISLASAAGGGTNILIIRLDPRYTQLVAFASLGVSAGVADPITGRIELDCTLFETWIQGVSMPLRDTGSTGREHNAVWTPPALLCSAEPNTDSTQPPRVRTIIPNVDGETANLQLVVYNFDKRARELTPIALLLASVPRATQVQV